MPNVNGYIGIRDANTFDYTGSNAPGGNFAWQLKTPMLYRRWYPTVTALGTSGEALAISGQRYGGPIGTNGGVQALIPEVYNGTTWLPLTGASRLIPSYPWMFLAPNGQVFNAGPNPDAKFLDTNTRNSSGVRVGAWGAATYTTRLGTTQPGMGREYGSAVMYAPGKILILGGANANGVTNTTELIDINAPASAAFQTAAPMLFARTHVNATILADGTVLATGGTKARSNSDYDAVLHAELWQPGGTWTLLNEMSVPRLYHSTAVLLPDATVLTTGGGEGANFTPHPDYQIFTPPYLCKGLPRPEISSAPQAVAYGQVFTVSSPDADAIRNAGRATLVRLSSVTHSFNMNQRFIQLTIANAKYGQLYLTAPSDPNVCPPGHYMLFLIDGNGTPSHASIIAFNTSACTSLSITQTSPSVNPNDCSRETSFTVNGGSPTSTYVWTVNGATFSTQPNQTTIQVVTSTANPTVQVAVKLDNSACGASSTLTSYFPGCFGTAARSEPGK